MAFFFSKGNVDDKVVQEIFSEDSGRKKKKKKKKKSKSKLRRRRRTRRYSSPEAESEDPFDDVFDEAVRDTHLDNIAERQLKELDEMQKDLKDLQGGSDPHPNTAEDDQQYLPPSNQEAQYNNGQARIYY